MTAAREIVNDQRDQFAFHDDIVYLHESGRGLSRQTVEEISALKDEPAWMLQFRLRAYEHFLKRPMPNWTDGLDRIDFDRIVYYRRPSEREIRAKVTDLLKLVLSTGTSAFTLAATNTFAVEVAYVAVS